MNIDFPILSLMTFLPLVGVALIFFVRGDAETVARNARNTALLTTTFTLILSLFLYAGFDKHSADFQFVEQFAWIPGFNINYKTGIDGISLFFILLSAFLTPVCIIASWNTITHRVKEYMIAFLLLETMMIGMFAALDLVLFYIFFEGVLIPMFIIIGVWGGTRRVYAAFKFFLYTLLGSVLMLVAMLALYNMFGTTDMTALSAVDIPLLAQKLMFLAFFASFAVKVPMFPVHTWLPDAHVEAPTAGSVILAGVLLKMGGYGFLRISVPFFPDATQYFTPLVFALSAIAVIYASLVALVQDDMKKLIAYSSIAHMGFVTIGIFTLNQQGVEGAMFQMVSHGIVAAALFLCVGVVYDRLHTREIARYGGLVKNMPKYATVFLVFVMASVGLPGTSGFVGEFLVIAGAYQVSTMTTFFAATGLILGAAYMLYLYKRVALGDVVHEDVRSMKDLSAREIGIFAPLALLALLLGVYPRPVLEPMAPSIERVVTQYHARIGAAPVATHETVMTDETATEDISMTEEQEQ